MSKHTPGLWVARQDPNACLPDDWCVGIEDRFANIDKVAVCSKRDARLIAAAPELLEALKALLFHCEETARILGYSTKQIVEGPVFKLARDSIAKAEGDQQ